jgi:hypothetical protein
VDTVYLVGADHGYVVLCAVLAGGEAGQHRFGDVRDVLAGAHGGLLRGGPKHAQVESVKGCIDAVVGLRSCVQVALGQRVSC